MKSEEGNTISVLAVTKQSKHDDGTRGMFPSFQAMAEKVAAAPVNVSSAVLAANLRRFMGNMDEIIADLPEPHDDFEIDAITLSLAIDASGKISLIGEASIGITPSITITLKRQRPTPT